VNDDNVSIRVPIKKSKSSKTGVIVINSQIMEMLEQIGVGVGDAIEIIFDVEEKKVKTVIKKKQKGLTDEELYEKVMKNLREHKDD